MCLAFTLPTQMKGTQATLTTTGEKFLTAGEPPSGRVSPKRIHQYHVPIKLQQYLFLYSNISVVGTSLNILLTTNAKRRKNGAQISQYSKKPNYECG